MASKFASSKSLRILDGSVLAKRVALWYLGLAALSALALRLVNGGVKGFISFKDLQVLSTSLAMILVTAGAIYVLVRSGTKRLVGAFEEVIEVQRGILQQLAMVAKFRDGATSSHTLRVGQYAEIIALEMGIEASYAALINEAAQLHDIGKLGIPDAVLLKNGRLADDERAVMQRHVTIGAELLSTANSPTANSQQPRVAKRMEKSKGYRDRGRRERATLAQARARG
jgi:putative nucleotidyltransferase with HDIG domain